MQTVPRRPRGRPKAELVVSAEQRAALERWARRPKTAQALALRARIVLGCAAGLSNGAVASDLGVHAATVGKWRRRFVADGLDGLLDAPRPGAPRRISDEQVELVLRTTLEQQPADATQWSTRSMAAAAGLSQSAVSRIWRAFALQPHRIETFTLSADPLVVEKVRDVVGLYLDPPERALVLCVDETSQIQALDRSRPTLPMLPGTPARRPHHDLRHATTSLFAALDIATGRVTHQLHRRHRALEFRTFLDLLDQSVPAQLDVHLILDNDATHKTAAIRGWLLRHPRFQLHFIPTSSSWLNLVERWFAELTTTKLQRGIQPSVEALEADITAWAEHWNADPRPYIWTKTADEILTNPARYCQRISDSGH